MKRWIIIVFIASVLLIHGKVFVEKGIQARGELPVYVLAAARMANRDEIYHKTDNKPFTYPPFFALPFIALTQDQSSASVTGFDVIPFSTSVFWYLINVGALAFVISVVRVTLVVPRRHQMSEGAFWVITFLLCARNVASVFSNQSHDLVVFAIIAVGVYLACRPQGSFTGRSSGTISGTRSDMLSGAFLGLAAACKATPLLFLLDAVVRRRPLSLIAILGALGAATILPDLIFPRRDGNLWVMAWLNTFVLNIEVGAPVQSGPWSASSAYNQSLAGTLHRILNLPAISVAPGLVKGITLLAFSFVVSLVAWCALLSSRLKPENPHTAILRFGQLSTILCAMVLISPMSSKSHFCVLLFPMAFCVAEWLCHRERWLAFAIALMFLVGTLTSSGILGDEPGAILLTLGTVTWTAMICLITVTLQISISSRRADQLEPASPS